MSVPVEALTDLPAGQMDLCDEALASISTDAAVVLITTLPQDQAEAVLLRVVVGLDTESVARVLGKRPGAVRVATHRGLRRLAGVIAARKSATNPLSEQKP
jgi:RNA polymerase sigma-70 factor, ECF subfamily